MACRISELVLKCHDPEVLARFWCEVLDFVVLDREEDGSLEIGPREGFGGPQPTIILSRRDEPEKGKSRLHIDVNATDRDQDAELERLLQLGARPADIDRSYYAEVDRLGEGRQSGSRRRLSRQNSLPSGSARTCQDASAG